MRGGRGANNAPLTPAMTVRSSNVPYPPPSPSPPPPQQQEQCLTALVDTPEPTVGHGVAIGLSECASPPSAAQRWVVLTARATQVSHHADNRNADGARNQASVPDKEHASLRVRTTGGAGSATPFANVTLRTALPSAPRCFGVYHNDTCTLLTVLAWEKTEVKTVMLWSPALDSRDPNGHPQRWTYDEITGTLATVAPGAPPLCLAHAV